MPQVSPNIRIERTEDETLHCFRITFDNEDGTNVSVLIHARELIDFLHGATVELTEWLGESWLALLRERGYPV